MSGSVTVTLGEGYIWGGLPDEFCSSELVSGSVTVTLGEGYIWGGLPDEFCSSELVSGSVTVTLGEEFPGVAYLMSFVHQSWCQAR